MGPAVTSGVTVPFSTRKIAPAMSGPFADIAIAATFPACAPCTMASIVPWNGAGSGSPLANDRPPSAILVVVPRKSTSPPLPSCGRSIDAMPRSPILTPVVASTRGGAPAALVPASTTTSTHRRITRAPRGHCYHDPGTSGQDPQGATEHTDDADQRRVATLAGTAPLGWLSCRPHSRFRPKKRASSSAMPSVSLCDVCQSPIDG